MKYPVWLAALIAASVPSFLMAADATTKFDGKYVGETHVTASHGGSTCRDEAEAMTISGGRLSMPNNTGIIEGTVSGDGNISARAASRGSSRNSPDPASLVGTITGDIFAGKMVTPVCDFAVSLKKQ